MDGRVGPGWPGRQAIVEQSQRRCRVLDRWSPVAERPAGAASNAPLVCRDAAAGRRHADGRHVPGRRSRLARHAAALPIAASSPRPRRVLAAPSPRPRRTLAAGPRAKVGARHTFRMSLDGRVSALAKRAVTGCILTSASSV